MPVQDLSTDDVARGLSADSILLIDVREPHEFQMAHIPGSLNLPLSSFDPRAIPNPDGKRVVFMCAAGMRSLQASEIAQTSGKPYDAHLAGGIKGWVMDGQDIVRG
ncbi:rhodanese-like domain-containing protein [Phreatobacter sp.]|uniref:rhodanese-like domain-containing protein n=1 Tax=Phreatobacter sp. TaxID=1966341 RepID=UPI0026010785|nr:rhodanese-like domain-containing protein [Phreatobacter sp.]